MNLAKQSIVYTIVKVFSLASLLLINLSLSQLLSEEKYAEYGQITAIFSFLMLFNWGVPTYLEKILSKKVRIDIYSIWRNYLVVLLFSLSIVVLFIQFLLGLNPHRIVLIYFSALINLNGLYCIILLRKSKRLIPIIIYLLGIPFSFLLFMLYTDVSVAILLAYIVANISLVFQFDISRLFKTSFNFSFFSESLTIFFYNTLVYGGLLLPRVLYSNMDSKLYSSYTFTWFLSNTVILAIQSLTFMLQPRLYKLINQDSHNAVEYNRLYRFSMMLITFLLVLMTQSLEMATDLMSSYDNIYFVLNILFLLQIAGQQGYSQKYIIDGRILSFTLPLLCIPLLETLIFETGLSLVVCLIVVNIALFIVNTYRKINMIIEVVLVSSLLQSFWLYVLLVVCYIFVYFKSRSNFAKDTFI